MLEDSTFLGLVSRRKQQEIRFLTVKDFKSRFIGQPLWSLHSIVSDNGGSGRMGFKKALSAVIVGIYKGVATVEKQDGGPSKL